LLLLPQSSGQLSAVSFQLFGGWLLAVGRGK